MKAVRPSPLHQSSLPYLHEDGSLQSLELDDILAYYTDVREPVHQPHGPLRLPAAPVYAASNLSRPIRVPLRPLPAMPDIPARTSSERRPPPVALPSEVMAGLLPELSPPLELSPSPSPPERQSAQAPRSERRIGPTQRSTPAPQTAEPSSALASMPRVTETETALAAALRAIDALPGLSRSITGEPMPVLAALLHRGRKEGDAISRAMLKAWDLACQHGQWSAFEPALTAATEAFLAHARAVLRRDHPQAGCDVTHVDFARFFGRRGAPYLKVTVGGVVSALPMAHDALRTIEAGPLNGPMCLVLQRFYHHLGSLIDRAPLPRGVQPDSKRGEKISNHYLQLRGVWNDKANALGDRARLLHPSHQYPSFLASRRPSAHPAPLSRRAPTPPSLPPADLGRRPEIARRI